MYSIPTSIKIDGKEYHIRNDGDYRVILDCFQALGDVELTAKERLLAALIIFYSDFNSIEDLSEIRDIEPFVEEMYNFFNCEANSSNIPSSGKLIDWEQDSQLICSAINKVANLEVRAVPYLHWWTFMGYYSAIGESPLATIVHIRDKILRNKKLEKHEREYRMNNPQYFIWNNKTIEEKEADKLVREIWNSGG